MPLFGAAFAASNKGTQVYTDWGLHSPKTVLNLSAKKNQGLFKAFECFSSTFQGKYNFQGLFKTVLYIQVLFKPALAPFKEVGNIKLRTNKLVPTAVRLLHMALS